MLSNIKPFITKMNAKTTLKQAFDAGHIYLSMKNSGGKELRRYPKVHNVDVNKDFTRFIFTLPNGFDPKDIAKKEYAFMQVFGPNAELEGDLKKYVLTVYKSSYEYPLTYNFKDISLELKGFKMPILCGKDRNGNWMIYDAITEPNALISGEPGGGKSTQLISILSTLIQCKSPDELHLYLGDLKMSEFHIFKNVAHVKDISIYPEQMAKMLTKLHKEMKKRSELLNVFGANHVDKLPKDSKVPYILLAIDEIVMIMDDKDMKKMIVQLASLGRALGIYIMLSLQRPSHDILDTKIRSLLTVRIGFRTTDLSNSKIIGTPGSEKISKKTPGRFYIKRDELKELQAPYLEEEKAKKILDMYRVAPLDVKEVFDEEPPQNEEPKQLTYDDIFGKDEDVDQKRSNDH